MTSCGLNGKPLEGSGTYPAAICCNLTNFQMFPKQDGSMNKDIPYITGDETQTFVKNISDKTVIGYKYFQFHGQTKIGVKVRGDGGVFEARTTLDGEVLGSIKLEAAEEWQEFAEVISLPEDVAGFFFTYRGSGRIEFIEFTLVCES